MKQDLQQMYRRAMDLRTPWITRWDSALRYTFPRSDDDAATLFDATAADAADNLAASIYSLLTPPESLWISLVPESADSPDATAATAALRVNLNDSNFYTTIHQCYMDLIVLGTACLFMAENPIGAASAFSFTAIPMRDIAILNDAVFHTANYAGTRSFGKISRLDAAGGFTRYNTQQSRNTTDTGTITGWNGIYGVAGCGWRHRKQYCRTWNI